MKKKLYISLFVYIVLILCGITTVNATNEVNIRIDGYLTEFDLDKGRPFIDNNGRTQVPLRGAMEAIGAIVGWNSYERAASVTKDDITVIVPIGKNYVFVNGVRKESDTAAIIVNNRTYLPIRIVAESLGAEVQWDSKTKTIDIITGFPGGHDSVTLGLYDLSDYIGKPISSIYSNFGYYCEEGWSDETYAPMLYYPFYELSFSLNWDVPNFNILNPRNLIYGITSYGEYPIWGDMTGLMSINDLELRLNDSIKLDYDNGEDSEADPHYYITLEGTDTETGEQYYITYVWLQSSYPTYYAPSSYAVLEPIEQWAIFQ